jgi:hypothetical protein
VLATRGVLRTASNGIHEKFGKLLLSQGLLLHFRSRHSIFRLYQLLSARVCVQTLTTPPYGAPTQVNYFQGRDRATEIPRTSLGYLPETAQ